MLEAIYRFFGGGITAVGQCRGHEGRDLRTRRVIAVESLDGRMLLTGGAIAHTLQLAAPHIQPLPSAQQIATNDLFSTLDGLRGSASGASMDVARVRNDITIIFGTAPPSSSTVATFLADYQAGTAGHTLNPSSVPTLQGDLSAMLGSSDVSMARFRSFFMTQSPTLGRNGGSAGPVSFDPSFNDVRTILWYNP